MIKLEKKKIYVYPRVKSSTWQQPYLTHLPGFEPGSLARRASIQPLNHKCYYPPPVTGLEFYTTCCLITSTETREKRVSGT